MKITSAIALLFSFIAGPVLAEDKPILLWPNVAPGEKGEIGEEINKAAAQNKIRITNVTRPTITFFRPPPGKANGAAVLVCPGGGYNVLASDIEGTRICEWLNSMGVTGIILKYRVPRREGLEKHVAPLQDAQRAMGMLRHRAKEWNLDPAKLGIIGFSAGGHLAASLSTNFDERSYPVVDESDKENCRPDFAMLIYPFYLTLEKDSATLAPEIRVSEKTPPTFIVMTQDDRVEYAYAYALALKRAKVPAQLHIYPTGGHGYGLGDGKGAVSAWPTLAREWLRENAWAQ
jgi:acetyl esterase/lipase